MLLMEPLLRLGSLSCWKTQPWHILLREGSCWPKSRDTWPHPSSPQYGAVALSPLQKSTPKAWCFRPHASRLGWCSWDCLSSSSFLQTQLVEFIPKSSILVSSDHMTFSHASSGSSRWSLANFRQAWACAGLSTGTLRALQDLNPWHCSVLLMRTFETVVPALFRLLTRSSRVVLGWSLIIDTPWGEILHGAPVRGRLTVLPFSNNCANSCCLVTKLFAYCPVAHPSLVQVYNFVPSVLRQLFVLAHSGKAGVWLIEGVNRCLLYR